MTTISISLNSAGSIHTGREVALDWMHQNPQSAVVVVLEGHSNMYTGNLEYATPGNKKKTYASIDHVSSYFYGIIPCHIICQKPLDIKSGSRSSI
jgi:hypothetical protein